MTKNFCLYQNNPNPFKGTTAISFFLPENVSVEIDVYNIIGQKILNLVNIELFAGQHVVNFGTADMPSGFYFCHITAGNFSDMKRILLLK